MSYKNLTAKQIYEGEVSYTLDDFAQDFRIKTEQDWSGELLNRKNKSSKSLYQGILSLVVFASQRKSVKFITETILGKSTKELLQATKEMIDMYKNEVEILEGLQMKIFLDNLKKYKVSDSINLKLLNADIKAWFKRALDQED